MEDELLDAVEEVEEELFPPRPGGLVDRHRKRVAAQKAQQDQAENAGVPVEERGYKAVKVAAVGPESVRAQTFTIGSGEMRQILPNSEYRNRATIVAFLNTADTDHPPVPPILAQDESAALGQNGFMLPGSVPISVHSRAQLWAFNPDQFNTVQISVMSEIYAPEGGK